MMPNSNAVVLEGKDLAKEFVQGDVKILVLRAASITVRAGERIAIVGASGSARRRFCSCWEDSICRPAARWRSPDRR